MQKGGKNCHRVRGIRPADGRLKQHDSREVLKGVRASVRMRDNNLSQSELGRKLGRLSRQDLSKMENGRRPISRRMALRLASFFGVSVDKFVGEEYPASGGSSDQP